MPIYPLKLRQQYAKQKCDAKARGIEWQFTLDEWVAWWGKDIENRGVRPWNLQMQRFHDSGPYHPDNVRKAHPKDNAKTAGAIRRTKNAFARKAEIEKALDQAETNVDADYHEHILKRGNRLGLGFRRKASFIY